MPPVKLPVRVPLPGWAAGVRCMFASGHGPRARRKGGARCFTAGLPRRATPRCYYSQRPHCQCLCVWHATKTGHHLAKKRLMSGCPGGRAFLCGDALRCACCPPSAPPFLLRALAPAAPSWAGLDGVGSGAGGFSSLFTAVALGASLPAASSFAPPASSAAAPCMPCGVAAAALLPPASPLAGLRGLKKDFTDGFFSGELQSSA